MAKQKENRSFRSRLSNFWYYYKWHSVVALVIATTVAFATVQCVTAEKYDYTLLLACSEAQFSNAQTTALAQQLALYGEDLNQDGKINVQLLDCTYSAQYSSRETVNAQRQKLQSQIMSNAEALLILTDNDSFEWLDSLHEGGFMETLQLPLKNGRAMDLDQNGLYTKAMEQCSSELIWPKQLYLSRRIVKDTLIERDEDIAVFTENCDAFLNRLLNQQPVQP